MRKRAAIESHRCTLHRTVIVPAHNLTFVCCGTAHGGARFAGNVQLHFRPGIHDSFTGADRCPGARRVAGVRRAVHARHTRAGDRFHRPPAGQRDALRSARAAAREELAGLRAAHRADRAGARAAARRAHECAGPGEFAPRAALERMLAGTGLRAEFSRPDEAIIVAQPAAEQAPATADTPADAALPIDGIGDSGDRRAFAGCCRRI